jgi:hypothetical protein
MASFRLEYYSFRIKKKHKEEYTNIESALDNISFSNFFKKFAGLFEAELEINEENKRTFQFQPKSLKYLSKDRFISGIILGGDFGLVRGVTDILTKKIKSKLLKTDSVISPFYFFLYFPHDSVVGYLCVQRIGIKGISEVFFKYFREFFRTNATNYTLEHSPLVSKEMLLKLIDNGAISEVTLRRYNLPSESTQQYKVGIIDPSKPITAEFSLKSKGLFPLKERVTNYINDKNGIFFDFPALKDMGFDENSETSITLENGKNSRTIILNHLDRFKTSFDIDNQITIDADGYPNFDSINQIARDIFMENFVTIDE